MLIWATDTFTLQWKITLDQITGTAPGEREVETKTLSAFRNSYFTSSASGELLAGSTVYVWNLVEKRLMHEILIPSFENKLISQIEFIGSTNIVAVLSNTGDLIFLEAADARFVGQLEGRHKFKSFAISPDGRLLSTILLDAKYLINMLRLDPVLEPGAKNEEVIPSEETSEVAEKLTSPVEEPVTEKESYEALLDQGMHPSVKDFRKKFPLKSDRLAKSMERVLSALAYWSPIFENLEYLPSLVFPFVKLFIGDMFSGLEVVMTVLANWCQKWWEYYPNPPIECLDIIEDLLGYHDSELLGHLVQHKVTSQVYAWLPLRALFSELFSKNDWLQIWDHFVTAPPSFAYYFLVAYLIGHRVALLDCKKKEEFKHFFQRRTPTANVSHVIQSAYHLAATTPSTVSPSTFLAPFRPLLKGEYPLFNQYPEFIVNYQSKMKERIRKDEEECLRKRKVADEVSRLTEELRKDRRAWESADWKMNDMVEKWWEQMMGEEETHAERKARLDAMEKEQRARAMREIAEARRSFVSHKKSTTQSHLSHLSKAVGTNQRSVDVEADRTALDVKFAEVEDEWTKRGEEMRKARERVVEMERNRVERLVRNAKRVGVRDDEIDEQVRRRIFGAGKGKERARTPAEGESRVPSPEKRGGTEDVREESPKSPNQDPGGPSNVHIGTDQVPAGGGEGRRGSPW
ncbi:TBC1 domain member 31 [Borealophlyctis nickersoniae]|nr:TBC1 domain member 31 [Borealophlyctis nickersoniae]